MTAKYTLADKHFIWHEDPSKTPKMIAYVFDPQDAAVMVGMLNAAVALADAVLLDTDTKTYYTWDGEVGVRHDH